MGAGAGRGARWATAALLCLLPACGGGDAPRAESVHRRALEERIKGFDPAHAGDAFTGESALQLYEPLYEWDYAKRNPFVLTPLTAAALPTVSEDGLTLTIPLKAGVRFHDDPCFPDGAGRPLSAVDYIYAWKRVADPATQTGTWGFLDGKIEGLNAWREAAAADSVNGADYSAAITGLQAGPDNTLVIRLTKPDARFANVLAMPFTAAVPAEAVRKYGETFGDHAVGTGAWLLEAWVRDSRFTLVRNPEYHREGLPAADRVEVAIMPEPQPRWLSFLAGEIDFVKMDADAYGQAIDTSIAGGALTDDLKQRGVQLETTPLLDLSYTVFNMQDPVVGGENLKLRQAIACAVDRERARQMFQNGRGVLAQSPIPPGLFGYDPQWKHPVQAFDLDKAKTLLAEAGYPEGKGLPELVYEMHSSSTSVRHQAELFRDQVAKIGVKVRLEPNAWPGFTAKVESRSAQIFGIGWGADYPDPENFLQLLYGPSAAPNGPNASNFQNAEYDALFTEIVGRPDTPERLTKIRRMVAIACEHQPWILGLHRDAWVLSHPWCANYRYPVIGGGYWKYIRIEPRK